MFNYAGVSKLKGVVKLRVTNDTRRVKTLRRNGHTNIEFVKLPYSMTKLDAAKFLIKNGFADERRQALVAARNQLLPDIVRLPSKSDLSAQ